MQIFTMSPARRIAQAFVPLLMGACTLQAPPVALPVHAPAQWSAPMPTASSLPGLPHRGNLTDLTRWWEAQGDPLLVEMISSAQVVSPSIATARSRIEQTGALRTAAGAARLPSLSASASASHGYPQGFGFSVPSVVTPLQAGLQTAWEIDLFGGQRARHDAAQMHYEGAQAQWHDARVLVAAEVAHLYYSMRLCEKLWHVAGEDAASRAETAQRMALGAAAGFIAPATVALADAFAADGHRMATEQRARCERDLNALVALTGLDATALREKLAVASTDLSQTTITIASVPAAALAQRPDLFQSAREVTAAYADIGSAQAERYPHLSLNGSIVANRVRGSGVHLDLNTWSIGPLIVSLPLFDGGRRAADVTAARARYNEAITHYHARVRQAVREVEDALVNLQSIATRSEAAVISAEGHRVAFVAAERRDSGGIGNRLEMEEARRGHLAAEAVRLSLQYERAMAWVALYRAMGGGWTPAAVPASETAATPTS